MQDKKKQRRKPAITLSQSDHARLSLLAEGLGERDEAIAEELTTELERARVVSDKSIAAGIVQMGSMVKFKPDTGEEKVVTLVFPGDADIAQGKVSILTPIGTALIGLAPGQSMSWTARDGRSHELTVLDVSKPAGH